MPQVYLWHLVGYFLSYSLYNICAQTHNAVWIKFCININCINSIDVFLYNSEYILLLLTKIRQIIKSSNYSQFDKFFKSKLHNPILVTGLFACATARLLGLRVRTAPGDGCLSLVSVVCCRVEL